MGGLTAAVSAVRFGARGWTMVAIGYVVVACAVTHPLAWNLGTQLPGVEGDAPVILWAMDHFWSRLADGKTPFIAERILVPVGANLMYSAPVPVLAVFALPFLNNLILYGGLLTFTCLVGAAAGMARLVRVLSGDDGAAALAGLIFGFSPTMLSLVATGRLPQMSCVALMPLAVLALVRFVETGSGRPLVVISLVLWVLALTQVYSTASLFVLLVVMGLVLAPRMLKIRYLGAVAVAVGANLLVAWMLLRWVLPTGDISDVPGGGFGFTSTGVVNLQDLLLPSGRNPVLGAFHEYGYDRWNGDIPSYFLGWGVLAIGLGGVVSRWRDPRTVALLLGGVATVLVAAGSVVRFGPRELLGPGQVPFDWLVSLPYLGLLDTPRRLIVAATVPVAALAGIGLAGLVRWTGRRRLVLLAALLLVAVEYGQVGGVVSEVPVPEIYRRLATRPGAQTVFEFGGGLAYSSGHLGVDLSTPSAFLMYWQTLHRKPRVGGYVARTTRSTYRWFQEVPIAGDLLAAISGEWPGKTYSDEEVDTFVRTFNLGYVVIPPGGRRDEYAEITEALLHGWIAEREHDEAGYLLYILSPRRVPDEARGSPVASAREPDR